MPPRAHAPVLGPGPQANRGLSRVLAQRTTLVRTIAWVLATHDVQNRTVQEGAFLLAGLLLAPILRVILVRALDRAQKSWIVLGYVGDFTSRWTVVELARVGRLLLGANRRCVGSLRKLVQRRLLLYLFLTRRIPRCWDLLPCWFSPIIAASRAQLAILFLTASEGINECSRR
jgi:hypothetical protein